MKLYNDLLFKCYKYDLHFSFNPNAAKLLSVYTFIDGEILYISENYLSADWEEESTEEILMKMHEEVDAYLNRFSGESEADETEYAQAVLTEQERKMKEADVKEDDFL